MAKILDKKERVYDLKLTGYGKYLLSVGKYKPKYYAFFDDNIIYDGRYANISESQNQIHERIKTETSYIDSLVLFEDVEKAQLLTGDALNLLSAAGDGTYEGSFADIIRGHPDIEAIRTNPDVSAEAGAAAAETEAQGILEKVKPNINYYLSDVVPIQYVPRKDIFKYDLAIGDAVINSKQKDVAPAWKVVVLNGEVTSTERKFKLDPNSPTGSEAHIPQVNIRVQYEKEIKHRAHMDNQTQILNTSVSDMIFTTPMFAGNEYIKLKKQDPIIYVDEVNTSVLTENFDVEVFLVTSSIDQEGVEQKVLERKYFESEMPQIVDGIMTRATPDQISYGGAAELPTTAVGYYFDFRKDSSVDPEIVCKQMQIYNKTSYYIDLDIDCSPNDRQDLYNDIYGSEVEPEICLD